MAVTKPEMVSAVLYAGPTCERPSHKNSVAAAMVANVNENAL